MTSFGYAMWYDLLGRHDVTRVIPYLLLVPVTTVLGGVVFLGEPMTLLRFAGGALVIAGVAIMNLRRNPLRRRSPVPTGARRPRPPRSP